MRIKNKFIKSGIAYTFGNIMLKGINIITIPVFTIILSTAEYGELTYYNSWLNILTVFIGLNLYSSIRNAYVEYKDNINEYMSSIMLTVFTLVIIFMIGINLFFILFKINIRNAFIINILILNSFGGFIVTTVNTKYTFDFNHKKFLFLSFITTISGVIMSLIFIKYIFVKDAFLGKIVGSTLPMIILSLIIIIKTIKIAKFKYSKKMLNFALFISIPLLPHILSNFILSQSDRIMIRYYLGDKYTAIYGFIYNISMILTIVWSSLDAVWVPWYTRRMGEKKYTEIYEISKKYIIVFTIITINLLFISPEIVMILTRNKELWEGIEVVPPILISGYFMFLYGLPVNVEYFYKKTNLISLGSVLAASINIMLNLVFIPIYGYKVAALTTLISYIFLFIFHWINMKRICSEKIFDFNFIAKSIVIVLISALVFLVFKNNALIRFSIVICISSLIAVIGYKNKHKFNL